jgi:hypothetical protein
MKPYLYYCAGRGQRIGVFGWLLLAWLLSSGRAGAQTIVAENFNGAWTTPTTLATPGTTGTWDDDGATGDQQWHRNDYLTGWTATASTLSPYDADGVVGAYAAFNTQGAASGSTGSLISPVLDFSAYPDHKLLSFYLSNDDGADVVNVYLSTDGGLTYGSSLGTYGAAWNFVSARYRRLVLDLGTTTSSTVKIKFTATSDGGTSAIGLDNFRVVNRAVAPLSGTYTIDNTQPDTGLNFTNFTDAFTLLNLAGVGGPTTFRVANGQTFPEITPPLTVSGTAASPVLFQEATPSTSLTDNPTIAPASTETGAIVLLSGADYVTFDGINVQYAGTSAARRYGYVVSNASATDGATYNTIRNAAITLTRNTLYAVGLTQATGSFGGAAATASSGTNQHNSYYNLQLRNMTAGVNLSGTSPAYPDYDTQLYNCAVGDPAVTADIGGASAGVAIGIGASYQSKLSLHDNVLRNVVATSSNTPAWGMNLTALCGTGVDASNVYNNQVITVGSTAQNMQAVYGIQAGTAPSGLHTLNLYNNFVSDVLNQFGGRSDTRTRYVTGIYINSAGTTDQTINVSFNSVRINTNGSYLAASACYEISSTTGALVNTRNNVFANVSAAGFISPSGVNQPQHYVWVSPTAGAVGAAGSVSNYNDLYVENVIGPTGATVGHVGATAGVTYTTLAAWQAGTGQDASSVSVNPLFVSATDLHLQPTSPLFGLGTPLAGIATDIDNAPRSATAPTIGADDLDAPLPVVLTAFEAERQGPDALLRWATASEQRNRGFEVQVSADGTLFRPLAFVAGAGTSASAHAYRHLDQEAGKAGVRYYRLRQLGLDGTASYSPVRSVRFAGEAGPALLATPNPFDESLVLRLNLPDAAPAAEVRLRDVTGRVVRRQATAALPAGASQVEVPGLAGLAGGVYFVQLLVPGQPTQHLRVVRQ